MNSFLNHPQNVKWVYAHQVHSEPFPETFGHFCFVAFEGWVSFSSQNSES